MVTPAHVPGLAELQGRRLAAVHQAHRLLQWAAVAPAAMPPEAAVRRAVQLLREPRATTVRVWVGRRVDEQGVEWLVLPGAEPVAWT